MEIVLHEYCCVILDSEKNVMIPSLGVSHFSDLERDFLENKIKKVFASDKRVSTLEKEGKLNRALLEFREGDIHPLMKGMMKPYFDLKMEVGLHELSDLILVDFNLDGIDYLLILDCPCKSGFSHHTEVEADSVNHILAYPAILSVGISPSERFVLYDWRNHEIFIHENKVEVHGEKKGLFAECIFDLETTPTEKEMVAVMEKSVKEISRKYDFELQETLPELKSAISACEFLEPEEVAKKVFEKAPLAQDEFKMSVANAGIKEPVPFDESRLTKRDRTMKFVTESGIEIIIPASFIKRKDKVQITNNPDGTTSIEIKNIEKLKNR